MTKKERFNFDNFDNDEEIWELLNIQAEIISDLEKENKQLKQKINSLKDARYFYKQDWKQASADCEIYKDEIDILKDENEGLIKENEQLKAQLYCDDEDGVCNICKYHYLVKDDEVELGYYNSRCEKGHYECARISLKYCEDFEKELEE